MATRKQKALDGADVETSRKGGGESFDDFADGVEAMPQFFPILRFGEGKLDEVSHEVRVLAEPRPMSWERDGEEEEGFAMDVELLPHREPYAVVMRKDPRHSLVRGIKACRDEAGGRLVGRVLRVSTRVYDHPRHGKTRGYSVLDVTDRVSGPEADVDDL